MLSFLYKCELLLEISSLLLETEKDVHTNNCIIKCALPEAHSAAVTGDAPWLALW